MGGAEDPDTKTAAPRRGEGGEPFGWLLAWRPFAGLSGALHLPTILLVAAAALALVALGGVNLPFAPFETRGVIQVDSPEVYTRERLVNDRYEQDHWLRKKLEELDATSNLLTATMIQRIGVGAGSGAPDAALTGEAPELDEALLPFDQEFRIRSAIRDSIRQLILENMLDDRHDLTGNSVYGLKFDTTLLPGTNTHRRAFVRVSAKAPPPIAMTRAEEWRRAGGHLPYEIWLYYNGPLDFDSDAGLDLHQPYELYGKWLKSVQRRLNDHVASLYRTPRFLARCRRDGPQAAFDLAVGKALELVLGVDQGLYDLPEGAMSGFGATVALPAPWSGYLSVQLKSAASDFCQARPWFEIAKVSDTVYFFDGEALPDWTAGRMHRYSVIERPEGTLSLAVLAPGGLSSLKAYYAAIPKFLIDAAIVSEAELNGRVRFYDMCLEYGEDAACAEGASREARYTTVPSGLFNFIAKIKQIDAYAYAVFPKNDAVGILADTSVSAQAALPEGAAGWLSVLRGMRESQTQSVLVGYSGFSGGGEPEEGEVRFGWVISGRGLQQPVQKAQMALVSVPAWATSLDMTVTRGWLGRESQELAPVETSEAAVPLPTDYEALDTILFKDGEGRRPKILNDFMREGITVSACAPARILIPGSRLWRSADVTLGAQVASKITVLPNMEGIVAEFAEVEIPNPLPESAPRGALGRFVPGPRSVPADLRVWTSEGMDRADVAVAIRLPEDGRTSCDDGAEVRE